MTQNVPWALRRGPRLTKSATMISFMGYSTLGLKTKMLKAQDSRSRFSLAQIIIIYKSRLRLICLLIFLEFSALVSPQNFGYQDNLLRS